MRKLSTIIQSKFDTSSGGYIVILLTLVTVMIILVGSPIAYFAEVDVGNIKTIGDAFWLSIMSITTIGFGDFYPVTGLGRVVVGSVAFFGSISYCALGGWIIGKIMSHTDRSTQNEELKQQNIRIEEMATKNEELNQFIKDTAEENNHLNKLILKKLDGGYPPTGPL